MDDASTASVEFKWSQGYNGGRIAFIKNDVLCYVCGHNIKFLKADTQGNFTGDSEGIDTPQVFIFPGEGMGKLAVHPHGYFAIAERCINPRIIVYNYPDVNEISQLIGGASLTYSHIEFSSTLYILSISHLPDFICSIWNYESGQLLCQSDFEQRTPTSVTFNPGNWRQICITTESSLHVWSVEQSDSTYIIRKKKLTLPAEDVPAISHLPSRTSSHTTNFTMNLPKAAIAGLVGDVVDRLDDIQDTTVRVQPVSHTWTPNGDILVGCKAGQLLLVDGDSWNVNMKYNPLVDQLPKDDDSPDYYLGFDVTLTEGSLDCILLHKQGLYAIGRDGTLRLLNLSGNPLLITAIGHVSGPVSQMQTSSDYLTMVLGSPTGSVHLYKPMQPDSLHELFDLHCGSFVGIDALCPGTERVVTVRTDGEIQIWEMKNGNLATGAPVGIQATSLACHPTVPLIVIGTASGHAYFFHYDTSDNSLRIIHRVHLYCEPITQILYQMRGDFLITMAEEHSNIYFLSGNVDNMFCIYGYTDVDGISKSMSMVSYTGESSVSWIAVTYRLKGEQNVSGVTHVCQLSVTDSLLCSLQFNESRDMFVSLRNDFTDEALCKLTYTFNRPVHGIAITYKNHLYGIDATSKRICRIDLPEKKPHRRDMEGWILPVHCLIPGHMLPGGRVLMSPDQKWITSIGTDGDVHVYKVKEQTLRELARFTPHDFKNNGVIASCYDARCTMIFSVGHDDIVTCHKLIPETSSIDDVTKSSVEFSSKQNSAIFTRRMSEEAKVRRLADWVPPVGLSRSSSSAKSQTEVAPDELEQDDNISTPTPLLSMDCTWREEKEKEARKAEDEEFLASKKDLRTKIREVRKMIQQMMRDNNQVPDIEKLGHHEFDLDIEEQTRLQIEGDQEVARIREEIEYSNLAKIYLKEAIKKECWDSMLVKGRSLDSFSGKLELSNYPLQAISAEKSSILNRVSNRRQLEKDELKKRREMLEVGLRTNIEELEAPEDEDHMTGDNTTVCGQDQEFGVTNPLCLSQFDLHSRVQKLDQIVLLEDNIYKIKENFNQKFDKVYMKKEQEIGKIKEKNKRISKILADLNFPDPMVQPEMSINEKPEKLFVVDDHEIIVEKYLTTEQKRQAEIAKAKEEERLQLEKGDNWRDRGLDRMMNGLLEIKKEDELKKDIPVPVFIRDGKDPAEWTDEEIKISKEYERKCAELDEEREKFRKQLETELRKLQAFIQETMTAFDDVLHTLFSRKTKTQLILLQEELKILRLKYSLLKEEEIETQEAALNYIQESKLHAKNESSKYLIEARQQVESFREQYDIIIAEDKILDKQFRREFTDCTQLQVELLYKLFKKRPKGHRYRGTDSTNQMTHMNPFVTRPTTAGKDDHMRSQMEIFLQDADDPCNMPEGISDEVWHRFCTLRRQKIDSELNVKQKTATMADMMTFVAARQDEDESLKEELDVILNEISQLKDQKQRFYHDLEIQIVLKQGQVEIDQGSFAPNYLDSVLLHRGVIEDLNVKIKQLGESKINSMLTSKKSRKGIVKLEWEYKKMLMSIRDLRNKMKDITFMKVTREIQAYLQNKDEYDALKNQEIATYEETINVKRQQHEEQLKEKRGKMHTLTRMSKGKAGENVFLDSQLGELNVTLNERKNIDDINREIRLGDQGEKCYVKIVQRRKLVDLAKAQAQEVAILRTEVERLRMRTFPALIQVER